MAWRSYGNLWVGIVARRDLIFFKLYAAADHTRIPSVHYQDLLSLAPTDAELVEAASWIGQQDPSPAMNFLVSRVVDHVRSSRPGTR